MRRRAAAADLSAAMSLRVDASVATRLAEHETRGGPAGARGWLVGPADRAPGDAVVIGTLCRQAESDVGEDLRRASAVLPGGLEVVGAYVSGDKAAAERLVLETKPHLEGAFLVAAVSQGEPSYFQRFSSSDAAVSARAEPLEAGWLDREYATFRCEMRVPIGAANSAGAAEAFAALEAELERLVFVVDVAEELARAADDASLASAELPSELTKLAEGPRDGERRKKSGKSGKTGGGKRAARAARSNGGGGDGGGGAIAKPSARRVVAGVPEASSDATRVHELIAPPLENLAVGTFATPRACVASSRAGFVGGDAEKRAPSVSVSPLASSGAPETEAERDTAGRDSRLPGLASFAHLDALAYTSRGATFATVAAHLRVALARRVAAARWCLTAAAGVSGPAAVKNWRLREPRCFHFRPPGAAHAVTASYLTPPGADPGADPDLGLERTREAYHARFGLPTDKPALRVANAIFPFRRTGSPTERASPRSSRLRDVHSMAPGLPRSHVPHGTTHCVRGAYEYYHYMQDRFDDNGWGCAYRSLQTLCSWFSLQNYTSLAPPTHREIQRALVDIGDKPKEFLGSAEWIGAVELAYVLDERYGVSCKILTVPSGYDLPSRARELARHFDETGTPVMMGGGKLAYTLLGVQWDEKTGECAFLILDPHYTGGEDLKAIVPRWCGWKKCEDVFARDFYNLLMPIPPKGV